MIVRRASVAILACAYTAMLVGLGLLIGAGSSQPVSAHGALLLVALLVTIIAIWNYHVERDPLSPLAAVALIALVFYVLRPWYILGEQVYGPANAASDRQLDASAQAVLASSLLEVLAALFAFFVLYVGAARSVRPGWREDAVEAQPFGERRALYALVLCSGAAVAVYGALIHRAGGFGAYVSGLSVRTRVFGEHAFLTQVSVPLKAAAFLVVIEWLRGRPLGRPLRMALLAALAITFITDLLSGGRGALVVGTLIPLLILRSRLGKRLSYATAILALAAVVSLAVVYRVVTRDAVYLGESKSSLVSEAVDAPLRAVVGNRDAIQFDSLMVVRGATGSQAPLQRGATYGPIASYVVPRVLWPGKPLGGGNAWFTQRYFPDYFGADRIETSVSGLGEAVANFGDAGGIALFGLLGLLSGAAYRGFRSSTRARDLATYAVVIPYVYAFIRGDGFHSVTAAATAVIAVQAFATLIHVPGESPPGVEAEPRRV